MKKFHFEVEHFLLLAEKKGFEPLQDLHPLAVFETAPFDHLGISPSVIIPYFNDTQMLFLRLLTFKANKIHL